MDCGGADRDRDLYRQLCDRDVAAVITPEHRRQLLVADRTGDRHVIAEIVQHVIACGVTPLEAELALRDGAAHTYLIAGDEKIAIVLGMSAWRKALQRSCTTPERNRAALAEG